MSVVLHWFLPTSGDSRTVVPFGADGHRRPPTIDYLAQIARAADDLGFTGVLTPTGTWCEDSWLVTAALLRETKRLKFLVAFRPELDLADPRRAEGGDVPADLRWSPAAQHRHRRRRHRAAPLRRLARPRRALRPHRRVPVGAARRARADAPYDFEGRYFHVAGATVNQVPEPTPQLYFGGASDAAELVAAKHVDVYLAWGEPPAMVAPRLARHARAGRRARADAALRHPPARHQPATGPRTRGPRPTASSTPLDPAVVDAAQAALARSASVGQQRMVSLHGGSRDDLVVAPNLWAGIGLVRGGAGTALVGSHERGRRSHRGVPRARLRRVHPLRSPAPRGGLLVRRGCDADPAPSRAARRGRRTTHRRSPSGGR